MDASLYEALKKTLEKWDKILNLLLETEITLSEPCKICGYYNYNCDECIASEDGICRVPDNKLNTYLKFEANFYSALDGAIKIFNWLEKTIKNVEKELFEGFRRLWEGYENERH